jgi:hypothetical protein
MKKLTAQTPVSMASTKVHATARCDRCAENARKAIARAIPNATAIVMCIIIPNIRDAVGNRAFMPTALVTPRAMVAALAPVAVEKMDIHKTSAIPPAAPAAIPRSRTTTNAGLAIVPLP